VLGRSDVGRVFSAGCRSAAKAGLIRRGAQDSSKAAVRLQLGCGPLYSDRAMDKADCGAAEGVY
jgi:hypothetical protein